MSSPSLLASAPSLDELHAAITAFYCGTQTRLEPISFDQWNVVRVSDAKCLQGVIVRERKSRYRFEME